MIYLIQIKVFHQILRNKYIGRRRKM
ncbi:hypothetical protein Goshw_023342 [Gossypium schwendimanii]|uniref:Uncharacterized protein n=1 Tax=Gossypium schwendimanii TaxID=34291 RepID=A0A7J9MDC7_GOSSC|nr:hypothetical protein [Gossypium schwendimanii]